MAKMGKCNFTEFYKFRDRVNKICSPEQIDAWYRECIEELAMQVLKKTKKKTPVDTGTLRRNWTISKIEKQGQSYIVWVSNNLEYSSFVETGHRKRNGKGWVPGKHMLRISLQEVERALPKFMERKMQQLLAQMFGGK